MREGGRKRGREGGGDELPYLRPVHTSTSMYIECTLKSIQFCPHYARDFAKLDRSQS